MIKNICIDKDDVVNNLSTLLLEALNHACKKDFKKSDWNSFTLTDLYEISTEDFFQIAIDYKVLENAKPIDGVSTFLEEAIFDHDVHIITARGWHPNGKDITHQWFEDYDLPYDKIHITGIHQSKLEIINHLDNIVLAVDDRGETCLEYDECGKIKKVLMVDRPWNHYITGIERINTLEEAIKYL